MRVRSVCAWLCAANLAWAADGLPQGVIIDKVVCRAAPGQSYALYLPSNYAPDRRWPILYGLDPGARGRLVVETYAEAAEHAGVIVVGSYNSRNGDLRTSRDAIAALVPDVHERFQIDDARSFAAGCSGSARVALAWVNGTAMAGAIAVAAGYLGEPPIQIGARVFFAAGSDDFNFGEVWGLARDWGRHGTALRFVEFEGPHGCLPAGLAPEALDFVLGRLPPLPVPETPDIARAIDAEQRLQDELRQPDALSGAIFSRLRSISKNGKDTPDRRAARRVVAGHYGGNSEEARSRMEHRDYVGAARFFENALLARPDAPGAWYGLALARSGTHNRRACYDALRKAIRFGFSNRAGAEKEPLFEPFLNDPKFQALMASIAAH